MVRFKKTKSKKEFTCLLDLDKTETRTEFHTKYKASYIDCKEEHLSSYIVHVPETIDLFEKNLFSYVINHYNKKATPLILPNVRILFVMRELRLIFCKKNSSYIEFFELSTLMDSIRYDYIHTDSEEVYDLRFKKPEKHILNRLEDIMILYFHIVDSIIWNKLWWRKNFLKYEILKYNEKWGTSFSFNFKALELHLLLK